MIKEICYFLTVPLTNRDYDRFGVQIWQKRGVKVSFLDLSALFNPRYLNTKQDNCYTDKCLDVFIAREKQDIDKFFESKNNIFGIEITRMSINTVYFYETLKKFEIPYASFCANVMPDVLPVKTGFFMRISSRLKITKVIKRLYRFYSRSKIQPATFIIVGGLKEGGGQINIPASTKRILAHTLDYDLFLNYRHIQPEPIIEGDYAVFLDEYFPLHPDYFVEHSPKNPYENPKDYYTEMNKIFDYLEHTIKAPIVVAAHPRSKYEKNPDLFVRRRILKGQTINLVAHAKYVLLHESTSVNFAVLFNKPIIFIIPEKAKNSYFERFIGGVASQFKKTPLDLSSIERNGLDIENEMRVEKKLYEEYTQSFIKRNGTAERYCWDIVADHILSC